MKKFALSLSLALAIWTPVQASGTVDAPPGKTRVEVGVLKSGPVEFQDYKLFRDDGPVVEYYISKTSRKAPLILYIQGSGCSPAFFPSGPGTYGSTVYNLVPIAASGRYSVMVVNKPFIADNPGPQGTKNGCTAAFNEYFTAEHWAKVVQVALEHARGLPWVNPEKTLILGMSEGATIASIVSANDKNVTNVALIGASGPTQYFDFVVSAYRNSANDEEARLKLEELGEQRRKIAMHPNSADEFAWGHPYKRWSSFFAVSSTQNILKSNAKVYLVSGMQDQSVPILSTEAMASELIGRGHDVVMRRIPKGGHNLVPDGGKWSDSDAEYAKILEWFDGNK